MNSIRRRLLLGLLAGLVLAGIAATLGVYFQAREEANALFDYQLRQMAASFPSGVLVLPQAGEPGAGEDVVIQMWNRSGVRLYLSRPGVRLPPRAELGYTTLVTEDGHWRVYSAFVRDNLVQVAQPLAVRQELAAALALRSAAPLALLLPLLGGLVWWVVGRGLRPLARVTQALSRRSAVALQPLSEAGLPSEVRPLVQALNELLGRLDHALAAQRAFIADAAHELRTPLTAVRLQAQLAERASGDAERARAFVALRSGLDRATHLVAQLLTLARNDPGVAERPLVPTALLPIAERVLAEQAPIAAAAGIDLGLARADAVSVAGDAEALRTLLGNLVDNAIRYTPAGGHVDVDVGSEAGVARLVVQDDGPGIPAAERERVCDRFYRREDSPGAGSGLGLAIVRSIAERHGATLALDAGPDGRGLRVTLRFPPAA
ncbi:two-component system OmpR family sensor kinase [Plasticicumulans lactativorans]|uniref:histidine kinase n=1 Tax=Plasticicumulans lactativorans TaxID=1133106 RepID=A0A4R2LFX0_9GAMM|nr:ATP-binding protein [Plasticicumulans lactativorans]TCO83631.1 two-component system OmpR family sensor kinase [Plasticicumulans lactativorans]